MTPIIIGGVLFLNQGVLDVDQFSNIYYPVVDDVALKSSITYEVSEIISSTTYDVETPYNVESQATTTLLQRYFGDKWEIFEKIAFCESGGRQNYDDGTPVESFNKGDWGYLQIREIHDKESSELNLNPKENLEDNIEMASLIFTRQGYGAWKNCAEKLGLI